MSEIKSDLFNKSVQTRQFKNLEVGADEPAQTTSVNTEFDKPMDYEAINAVLRARGQDPIGPQAPTFQQKVSSTPQYQPLPDTPVDIDTFKSVRAEVAAAKRSVDRISPSAKARIEALCGMFSRDKHVVIGNMTFTLKTLSGKETKEAMLLFPPSETLVELSYASRTIFLAASIKEIDGVDFGLYIEANDMHDKIAFLDDLSEVIVERLYKEYQGMVNDLNKQYAQTNSQEVSELASDLKK